MKAKAAVFMGVNEDFEIREFEITPPPKGYAQMDLIASGVCGTDLHIHNGKITMIPPKIIGHEFVGRITETNEAEAAEYGLKKGDCVIADIAVPCNECLLCKSGDDANCVNMNVTNGENIDVAPYLYGGYAEVNYTPLTNLIKVPESIDPTIAATFACPGPTAIHSFALAKQAGVDLSNINVAVVQGLGPVGIFAIMYLKKCGVPKIYAITAEDDPTRENLARQLGATNVFNIKQQNPDKITAELQAENNGIGVDLCFEASGSPKAVAQGIDILRNRGVYLVPGQYSNSGSVEIQPQLITFKALHIIGSSQYSIIDVKKYLEFLENNKDLHPVINSLSSRFLVENVNAAFEDAKLKRNVKTLLVKKL